MTTHPVSVNQMIEPKSENRSTKILFIRPSPRTPLHQPESTLNPLREFRRLVVVIPGQVTDQVQFSRAVRNLALPGQKQWCWSCWWTGGCGAGRTAPARHAFFAGERFAY